MLERTVATLTTLQRVEPSAIVSDAHPGYLSRRWAAREAARRDVPHLTVQHHHAHVASLLAEHQWEPERARARLRLRRHRLRHRRHHLGRRAAAGLLSRGRSASGHLAPVLLPGRRRRDPAPAAHGARASRGGRGRRRPGSRPGLGGRAARADRRRPHAADAAPAARRRPAWDGSSTPSPPCSACARTVDYEGQAAIELEALAELTAGPSAAGPWTPGAGRRRRGTGARRVPRPCALPWRSVRAGEPAPIAARAFHEGLAQAIAAAAVRRARAARCHDRRTHRRSLRKCPANAASRRALLARRASPSSCTEHVPPNDGGLALGQVAVAAAGGARTERG